MTIAVRLILLGLATIGIASGGALSISHFHEGGTCPMLGPLPACYLVFIGYSLIGLSTITPARISKLSFYIGWVPIFGLAAVGTMLHIFVGDTCPVSDNGMPQCYMSLALALVILGVFYFMARLQSQK